MLNDSRETMGAALYKLGYSVNATEQSQLEEGCRRIVQFAEQHRRGDVAQAAPPAARA